MDIQDTIVGDNALSSRLLLPFTHGVHAHALEYAVLLARSRQSVLVPFSLIYVPPTARGARLERIQQSKDFHALVQSKASRHGVAIEAQENYTSNVLESIHLMTRELNCSGIILFVCDGDGVLLSTNEVKHILTRVPGQHHVIRLQRTNSHYFPNPFKRITHIFSRHHEKQVIAGTNA